MTAYLDKEGVFIDDSKLVIHGTTYPLHNISSYEAVHKMKWVWDFKGAVALSLGGAFGLTAIAGLGAWLMGNDFGVAGLLTAALFFVVVFVIALIWNYRTNETTRSEFAFTALAVTVAGTTKHALIVKDDQSDLVYEAKDALDQALTAFSLR